MTINKTDIEGVVIIEPQVFGDSRGYFFESYHDQRYADALHLTDPFIQDNESRSRYGVVRGLHFQKPPYAQAKLIRVVCGEVLDVAVDIRRSSPTFGRHIAVRLSADNHRQLYLPRGMAHGFSVLSSDVIFQYKCDNYYHPESEGSIAWNDPSLAIDWSLPTDDVILSDKDMRSPLLADIVSPFE
ncbi:MAG: dTDP-4-dehydrorhamnose 3,5-epimerase [Bacteroidales bacterium]|nr:dTDP-4-dehydrorhamnose 3,5-epimerase [Bacteroidales bacterium]